MKIRPLSEYAGIVFLLTSLSHKADGVNCFHCDLAWTSRECMQQDPKICQSGQICFNTLSKARLGGKKFTKGCMDGDQCYSLQALNNRKICDHELAVCVYCCENNLCNKAMTSLPVGALRSMLLSFLTIMSIW